jgi:hypothetical protein
MEIQMKNLLSSALFVVGILILFFFVVTPSASQWDAISGVLAVTIAIVWTVKPDPIGKDLQKLQQRISIQEGYIESILLILHDIGVPYSPGEIKRYGYFGRTHDMLPKLSNPARILNLLLRKLNLKLLVIPGTPAKPAQLDTITLESTVPEKKRKVRRHKNGW